VLLAALVVLVVGSQGEMMAAIEIVRFRTEEETDEHVFAERNERFQREVVPLIPGLVRRAATRAANGEWMLVLRYADMESATRGPQQDAGNEVAGAFMSHIDMRTLSAAHYTVVSE
jgi:hypothetical protein